MIDFNILAHAGTTRERLKELFTAEMPSERILSKLSAEDRKKMERRVRKDIDKRTKFESMISSWINEQVVSISATAPTSARCKWHGTPPPSTSTPFR